MFKDSRPQYQNVSDALDLAVLYESMLLIILTSTCVIYKFVGYICPGHILQMITDYVLINLQVCLEIALAPNASYQS